MMRVMISHFEPEITYFHKVEVAMTLSFIYLVKKKSMTLKDRQQKLYSSTQQIQKC